MLHKIRLKPGLDKQSSDTGAEGKWVNADYTRFRYGFPEKIGGWQQLVADKLIGAGRDQHTWVDLAGNRFAAIGTNKCLYIYYEGSIYDITPLDLTRTESGASFTMVNTSTTVTITTSGSHGAEVGDIILLDTVTVPAGTGFVDADFEDIKFEVKAVPHYRNYNGKRSNWKWLWRNHWCRILLCYWTYYPRVWLWMGY